MAPDLTVSNVPLRSVIALTIFRALPVMANPHEEQNAQLAAAPFGIRNRCRAPCRGTGRADGEDIASMAAGQMPGLRRIRRSLAVVSFAVLAAQAVASGASASTQAVNGLFQQVTYRGYTFQVLSNWRVVRLALAPQTCVRFDENVLYLGLPSSNENCPSLG